MRHTCVNIRVPITFLLLGASCLVVMSAEQAVSAATPAQQSPAHPSIEIVSDRAAIGTEAKDVGERVRQVDAAIVARVTFSEVRSELRRDQSIPQVHNAKALTDVPTVVTESVVTVAEVIKGHPQMPSRGAVVRVRQPLGETTWNGRSVVRHDGQAKGL